MAMSTCFIIIFSSSAVVSGKTDMGFFLRYRWFKDKKKKEKKKEQIFAKKELYYCRGKTKNQIVSYINKDSYPCFAPEKDLNNSFPPFMKDNHPSWVRYPVFTWYQV